MTAPQINPLAVSSAMIGFLDRMALTATERGTPLHLNELLLDACDAWPNAAEARAFRVAIAIVNYKQERAAA
jgi:hypothetical protein